jgi:hypothetical protein
VAKAAREMWEGIEMPMRWCISSALLVGILLPLTGCDKVDKAPQYEIVKRSLVNPSEEDSVVTVHGFTDNLAVCLKLAARLNEEGPGGFRCVPLKY